MAGTILIVDDEQNVIKAISRSLRNESDEILTAGSAQEALDLLRQQEVDIIISDEKMPGMSGTDFFKIASVKYPDTVRIMLTGHATLESAIQAINQGQIFRFLTKPWNDADLVQTIRQGLEQVELRRENQLLQARVHQQAKMLNDLEKQHPGISSVAVDADGAIVIDDQDDAEQVLDSFLIDDPDNS